MENRDALLNEVDGLIARLTEYRAALEAGDEAEMQKLLAAGRDTKLEADRKDYHA
jgi:prephenate dehydrogenase